MGDPGVAKSQLLGYIDRLASRSEYLYNVQEWIYLAMIVITVTFSQFLVHHNKPFCLITYIHIHIYSLYKINTLYIFYV